MSVARPLVACLVPALLLTARAPAAGQRPVHWRLAVPAAAGAAPVAGQRLQLRLTARMDEGWYIYSLTQGEGGPFPMRITVPDGGAIRLDGSIAAPEPERHDDPNFGIVTETYRRAATFGLPVRLAGDPRRDAAVVLVSYQTCNDRICLPPHTDSVRLALASSTTPERPAAPIAGVTAGARAPTAAGGREGEVAGGGNLGSAASPEAPVPPSRTPALPQSAASARPSVGAQPLSDAAGTGGALGAFLWLAVVMGLLSLLTPCVFPMVPITVGFFTRSQATGAGGAPGLPPAAGGRRAAVVSAGVYAAGIVASFCALGVLITLAFGAGGVIHLAASPWLNLAVTALFLAFALNLLGVYELRLPSGLLTRLATPSGGHGPGAALLLGAAFAVTTFTCTAPFVGTLLVLATQGSWSWPVLGLLVFSAAFALPFFLLALVPHALERLPRSGEWMLTLRRALGVLEIAAAAKFLSNVDLVWRWGIFTRDVVLAIWAAAAVALALVLFGRPRAWRAPLRTPRLVRAAVVLVALAGGWWLTTGLRGTRLGEVEAFLPPPPGGTVANDGELPWQLNDFSASLARARAEARPLLIDFTGYTCTNCRWMEANMFPRAEVRARLEPFVRARLYTDGAGEPFDAQQALEERLFGTVALPLYAILAPSGRPVASFTGMTRDPARFAAFLTRGLEQARGR